MGLVDDYYRGGTQNQRVSILVIVEMGLVALMLFFTWMIGLKVSILVIVEMGLVVSIREENVPTHSCFNPCYSGNGFGSHI